MNTIKYISILFIISISFSSYSDDSDIVCKIVGDDWVWFSDHAATSLDYHTLGEPDRYYDIGTGVSIFGKPRGSIYLGRSAKVTTAYGIGALHIRKSDKGKNFKVCATSKNLSLISIPTEFPDVCIVTDLIDCKNFPWKEL